MIWHISENVLYGFGKGLQFDQLKFYYFLKKKRIPNFCDLWTNVHISSPWNQTEYRTNCLKIKLQDYLDIFNVLP